MHINNPGLMTKMTAMPIYGKKNLLIQNCWTDFKETWHGTLMTKILQCVYYRFQRLINMFCLNFLKVYVIMILAIFICIALYNHVLSVVFYV